MFDSIRKMVRSLATTGERRDRIPDDIQARLPLAAIDKVTFFKRDEVTTDLICCEVQAFDRLWFFHEEAEGWDGMLRYLETLPGFQKNWYSSVVHPPFAPSETIAFSR